MVETYIHDEVRKLYPDAELPRFDCQHEQGEFVMIYRSSRPFADLAHGLVIAAVKHFGDDLAIHREDLGAGNGTAARFTLSPHAAAVHDEDVMTCRN